ncbi:undecaprenyl diphosphate synthase family protein [Methanonatronarchaeum sp. AMET-Sl]|uniref:undecaprenyl diphosphate synthase family protein n=1 Tax=Methanonatronarchaeum sp. AMET-Sl TaxID=3037654 RepID=UPI00244E1EB9|nr:undecaprenyl diphosphate synthase family protein [Methanonatronarchaeum sp. AMET-Sl]WGI16722.1 undecaprenyl diphosphate synthase family protein [Methanonatronarchaeum sp. AMET-Sl]
MGDSWDINRVGIVVPDWDSIEVGRLVSVVDEFRDSGVSEVVFGFPGAPTSLKKKVLGGFSEGGQVVVVCKKGRDEVVRSIKRVCSLVGSGEVSLRDVDEDFLNQFFSSGDLDILIKVGEERLPNSLLWGLSYSEIFFVDSFKALDRDLVRCVLDEFRSRERRFGR